MGATIKVKGINRFCSIVILAFVLIVQSANAADNTAGNVTRERALKAESDLDNWMTYGRAYGDQRYSHLQQVDRDNVAKLGLDWYVDIPSKDGLSATPIVVDGVIYMSAPFSRVYAYKADTGKLLWTYDPRVERGLSFSNGWTARINRGVAVWNGKVIVATGDCRLVALDAALGSVVWTAPGEK